GGITWLISFITNGYQAGRTHVEHLIAIFQEALHTDRVPLHLHLLHRGHAWQTEELSNPRRHLRLVPIRRLTPTQDELVRTNFFNCLSEHVGRRGGVGIGESRIVKKNASSTPN